MTLVLLITAATSAWAQSSLNVVELEVPAGWQGDESYVTAGDLPGFKASTLEEAQKWKGAPSTGEAYLFYAFDGDYVYFVSFENGEPGQDSQTIIMKDGLFNVKSQMKFYYTKDPNFIDVTTNAASKQDLFTEAWFTMLASDVTVNYTLVRDMQDETNPVAFSGLPSSGKIIVKKGSDGKYQPAEALTIQLIDPLAAAEAQNIIAADGITIKVLVGAENGQGAIDYDQDNPITLEDFLADMKPGYYWIKAESTDENSPYDGTVYSQEFQVLNGYELTIAAGEYATFYKDENLYTEDKDAELYTIANVTDTEAQLSDAIEVAPAETPLLVYNKSEQDKTFLLIPTTDDAPEVTHAKEFMGSITSVELNASSSTADYYALNGKAFVWVKGTITIGDNKCWLQINNQLMAGRAATRSITGGGDTTGINAIDSEQLTDDNYYDLNGRKVEKPNRKGIYIHNGQKVVIR